MNYLELIHLSLVTIKYNTYDLIIIFILADIISLLVKKVLK